MRFLKKLKSGNFWISIISAGVLVAEGVFDFEIKTEYLNQILLGLMGILTMFGIVSDHGGSETILTTESDNIKQNSVKNATNKDNVESGMSSIKTICDTIDNLLNKVSINQTEQHDDKIEEKNITSELNNLVYDKLNNTNIDVHENDINCIDDNMIEDKLNTDLLEENINNNQIINNYENNTNNIVN